MPQSEAQKRAKAKYNAKTYKQLKASLKFSDYDLVDNYCKSIGISKASFIVKAVKYCMQHDIDLSNTEV